MIAMATSLEGSKTNFGLVIYSYGSINPENLAKIALVDFEITGQTASVNKIN